MLNLIRQIMWSSNALIPLSTYLLVASFARAMPIANSTDISANRTEAFKNSAEPEIARRSNPWSFTMDEGMDEDFADDPEWENASWSTDETHRLGDSDEDDDNGGSVYSAEELAHEAEARRAFIRYIEELRWRPIAQGGAEPNHDEGFTSEPELESPGLLEASMELRQKPKWRHFSKFVPNTSTDKDLSAGHKRTYKTAFGHD